jgi:hypothetical protein
MNGLRVFGEEGGVEFVGVGFVKVSAFGEFLVQDFLDPICRSYCRSVACSSQFISLGLFAVFQLFTVVGLDILKTLFCQIDLIEISSIYKCLLLL